MKRRIFISNAAYSSPALSLLGLYACKKKPSNQELISDQNTINPEFTSSVKLSLAQCSLHKMILNKTLNPMDFAQKAKAVHEVKVMEGVNLPNCSTLPDFGNFCLKSEGNELWSTPCIEEYDKYHGVRELMPYAKGVSSKSFNFDNNGQETTIDFLKMTGIVKDADYNGYVGIEYEGEELSQEEGILATKTLLINAA